MNQSSRILVISHNVFSSTTAMGKTLTSMLSCVPPENLAQLYFHSEIPTIKNCKNYFRIRDQEILLSFFTRHTECTIYKEKDIRCDISNSRTDKGTVAKIYQFSRRRSPLVYNLRNLMWKMGKWNSSDLQEWLKDFSPDLIFFASGDYVFSYRIAYSISCKLNIPIVMWCCDDYYFSRRNTRTIGGKYWHHNLMKWVHRISTRIDSVVVISDRMKQAYSSLFSQPINIIRISASENPMMLPVEERTGIVYVGSLGVNRIAPLVELGKQLGNSKIPGYSAIDVYSNDQNQQTISQLTEQNGIRFHGGVSADKVSEILGKARYVLYVEAFDENSKERTRYSLSTKIAESLQSGACIIAYGPGDISSIEYLSVNHAACVLKKSKDLCYVVQKLDQEPEQYMMYIKNAHKLAVQNHSKCNNDLLMSDILHISHFEEDINII